MAALYVRLWTRLLHDPTVCAWPPGQRWCWAATLLVAAESPEPGTLQSDDGPLPPAALAMLFAVDRRTLVKFLARADRAKMLVRRADGVLCVRNWNRYQPLVPPSDAPSLNGAGRGERMLQDCSTQSSIDVSPPIHARAAPEKAGSCSAEELNPAEQLPSVSSSAAATALQDFFEDSTPDLHEIGAGIAARLAGHEAAPGTFGRLLEVMPKLEEDEVKVLRHFYEHVTPNGIEHARTELVAYADEIRNWPGYAVGIAKGRRSRATQ